jgi:hypothetical protein
MGLGDYFKTKPPAEPKPAVMAEKKKLSQKPEPLNILPGVPGDVSMELQPPTPKFASSRTSFSNRSTQSSTFLDEIKHEVMVNYLYQQQCSHLWVADGSGETEGVLIRKTKGQYMACPPQLSTSPFAVACAALNVQCAMTVNSRVIKTFLQWSPEAVDVPLLNGLRIQILPTVDDLPRARKHQFAAFIASEALLVVWDDEALHVMERAKAIESELMELVWRTGGDEDEEGGEKGNMPGDYQIDEESGQAVVPPRPLHLQNTVLVAMTLILIVTTLGAGARQLAIATCVDGSYTRMALLALTPLQIFFTLFFAQVIVGCLAQIFGPIKQLSINSKFYSAKAPRHRLTGVLPHVTIQCPVYKEGLGAVIAPTVKSIKQAISTYELQGGSANMFINDDGLQIIGEEERNARIDFYADHSIGWVSRPKHGENGFLRRGKVRLSHSSCLNIFRMHS